MSDVVYSEIFRSLQGEGKYTGAPSVWIRLFLCQLQCDGFGQKDPTNPDTYELPYADFDVDSVDRVEDLPVWDKGCDSSYTWARKFKKLMHQKSASDTVDELEALLPDGRWGCFHFCITGGEPLLKNNQKSVKLILEEMIRRDNKPLYITFETNSITPIGSELEEVLEYLKMRGTEVFISMSPKLFRVSGEMESRAIKPSSIRQLAMSSDDYQLKFVVDDDERTWDDMERILHTLDRDVMFENFSYEKVWVMPVSATVEGQYEMASKVADMAVERGYNVAARVHCYIYGNAIGT